MSLPLGDGGIQFFRLFVKKWFLCNNIKTPQHNHFKITCLEMLSSRTSHTDQVFITCGIFAFLVSAMVPDINCMALHLAGRAFVS